MRDLTKSYADLDHETDVRLDSRYGYLWSCTCGAYEDGFDHREDAELDAHEHEHNIPPTPWPPTAAELAAA